MEKTILELKNPDQAIHKIIAYITGARTLPWSMNPSCPNKLLARKDEIALINAVNTNGKVTAIEHRFDVIKPTQSGFYGVLTYYTKADPENELDLDFPEPDAKQPRFDALSDKHQVVVFCPKTELI